MEKTILKTKKLREKAKRIHSNILTMDTHIDIDVRNFKDQINYTTNLDSQVNVPKMESGGLDAAWLVVYTEQDSLTVEAYEKASENAISKFEAIHRLCKEYAPDRIAMALTSDEVRKIKASGKKVVMIGVENAYPLGRDLSVFEEYHDRGARYMSLTHNGHNQFCDSHTGEEDGKWLHNGLSKLGKKAVNELNRLGIMVDVSHLSKESMMQIVQLSKAPIIASHSSARAICDHSRNMDNEQLLALKGNGGVIQTVAFSTYLNTEKHEARSKYLNPIHQNIADSLGVNWYERSSFSKLTAIQKEEFLENYPKIKRLGEEFAATDESAPPAVNVSDFVDHIDYLVQLIGIDHVGISSDFDGGGGIEGWSDASETMNVTLELVKRGYTESQIAKLWGENLFRVLDEVQLIAASLC